MNQLTTQNLLNRDELLQLTYKTAVNGRRFINFILDTLCYVFLSFMLGVLASVGSILTGNGDNPVEGINDNVINLLAYAGWVLYYTLFEGLLGKTPGKLITRTRVVNSNEQPISMGQAFGRSLLRLIPFEPLSFLGSEQPRGWHDRLSNTRVVKDLPTYTPSR